MMAVEKQLLFKLLFSGVSENYPHYKL